MTLVAEVKNFESSCQRPKPKEVKTDNGFCIYNDNKQLYISGDQKAKITLDLNSKYLYKPMTAETMHNLTADVNSALTGYYTASNVTFENCIFKYTSSATFPVDSIEHIASDNSSDYFHINQRPTDSWVSAYSINHTTNSVEVTFGNDFTTGTTPTITIGNSCVWPIVSETKEEFARKQMRSNMVICVKSRAEEFALRNAPQNELLALEMLREMISEEAFRKYLKHGFILVEGRDGRIYQIFRNKWHTKVWRGGKVIEEICVRISSDVKVPDTDNVIAFKTMIEADEDEFRKIGNLYKMQKAA